MQGSSENDRRYNTQNTQKRLQEMIDHLRADIEKVDEPQLKAMFETAAEALGGAEERGRLAALTLRASRRRSCRELSS